MRFHETSVEQTTPCGPARQKVACSILVRGIRRKLFRYDIFVGVFFRIFDISVSVLLFSCVREFLPEFLLWDVQRYGYRMAREMYNVTVGNCQLGQTVEGDSADFGPAYFWIISVTAFNMSVITGNSGTKLCPELAKPTPIITKDNVSALKLSTYDRTHGTKVTVSCLAAPDYQLVGPSELTCLSSGQWDKATPTCRLVVPTSGGGFDITMVPMLVAAGTMGVLLLALICIMVFVVCCWKPSKSGGFGSSMRGTPMGLFRSLSLQEAESVFGQRRHRYYAASECSDVIDSISARYPSHTFSQSPEVGSRYPFSDTMSRSSPTTYITAVSRGTELPYRTRGLTAHSYSPGQGQPRTLQTDSVSRASPTTFVPGVSRGPEPPLKIQVGTGQPYRTWHELFYNSYT